MTVPWWLVAALAVGGVVSGLLLSRRSGLVKQLFSAKIETVQAEAHAQDLMAQHGAETASAMLIKEHEAAVAAMNTAQRAQIEQLRGDPAALSRFLVGAAK